MHDARCGDRETVGLFFGTCSDHLFDSLRTGVSRSNIEGLLRRGAARLWPDRHALVLMC